ncbi:MAG: hypothetical protein M1827_002992 [Pycnora praestabilis]|nr:MAG: hypothetical protein M1827_002992 [Pycnora praestabilis]
MADLGPSPIDPSTPPRAEPFSSSITFPTTPTSIASSSNLPSLPDAENHNLLKPSNAHKPDHSPHSPSIASFASAGLTLSPISKSPKLGFSPGSSPHPLTGAAAMADQRRLREEREILSARQQSPNPANHALGALLGGPDRGISKPQEAPAAATTLSEPMVTVAKAITAPEAMQVDNDMQTSPVSMSSFGTIESSTAPTVTANNTNRSTSESHLGPLQAEPGSYQGTTAAVDYAASSEDKPSNRAFTFPGQKNLVSPGSNEARTPMRGMSLPHSGIDPNSPKSTSSKKHQCPYCSTDFTRHHNLKSHLLTHSHEKPYLCQTCQSRFRRLHDLKRHTKLHTGERPHICAKCGRKFARGDALARHTKGSGGCAGRRSSTDGYAGDDDFGEGSQHGGHDSRHGGEGDDRMDGLLYTGDASGDMESVDGNGGSADKRRRLSLPSIKAHDASSGSNADYIPSDQGGYSSQRIPSTYPPAVIRSVSQSGGGLYPPTPSQGGGSSIATSPSGTSISSGTFNVGGTSIFSQGGITESPKPLSPAGMNAHQLGHPESSGMNRTRSPSLTQQFQQQRFGRRDSGRTPPTMSYPPPVHGSGNSHPPQLPSLPGLHAPPDSRFTLPSQSSGPQLHNHSGSQTSKLGQSVTSSGITPSSILSQSSGGLSDTSPVSGATSGLGSSRGHGAVEGTSNVFSPGSESMWTYIRGLEDKINRLQDEVVGLKHKLGNGRS